MKTRKSNLNNVKEIEARESNFLPKEYGELAHWFFSAEHQHHLATEKLEMFEEIEAERSLENWEEDEKEALLIDLDYYNCLLKEEEK